MPRMDGTGPQGYGPGRRLGPGLGWFAAGYQNLSGPMLVRASQTALETRIAALKAELARTEELLGSIQNAPESQETPGDTLS